MSFVAFRKQLGTAAMAVALGLGAVGAARAAIFVGHFDPAFGPGVPDLGFRGSVLFSIPDACLSLSGLVSNGNACASGGMQNLNATVEFYNTTDPLQTTLKVQSFADQPLVDAVLGGGTLVGPDSLAIHALGVQVLNLDNSTLYSGDLWLQFKTVGITPNTYLYTCDPAANGCPSSSQSNPALLTLSVPEPAGYGLALTALAAGAVASARRRRQPG